MADEVRISPSQVRQAFDGIAVVDEPSCGQVAADLNRRYDEPHRRYHTAEHIVEMLAEVTRLGTDLSPHELAIVRLATLFHDAVYRVDDPSGASESASADLATATLAGLGIDHGNATSIEIDRLIRLTASHLVAHDDRTATVLVDADLWVLSAPPERYARYAVAVRTEFAAFPDEAWAVGRGAVLEHFLDHLDELYGAGTRRDRLERRERARRNLSAERARLTA